jgi:autotransporter adhesin
MKKQTAKIVFMGALLGLFVTDGFCDNVYVYDGYALSTANAYTDKKIQGLRGETHEGTALAIALSNPVIENGKKQAINVGVGQYESASAIGITYARRVNNDVFVDFGVSTTNSNIASKAGVNFSF